LSALDQGHLSAHFLVLHDELQDLSGVAIIAGFEKFPSWLHDQLFMLFLSNNGPIRITIVILCLSLQKLSFTDRLGHLLLFSEVLSHCPFDLLSFLTRLFHTFLPLPSF
jgi:hypothetical protein